jgi:hypothetical protein
LTKNLKPSASRSRTCSSTTGFGNSPNLLVGGDHQHEAISHPIATNNFAALEIRRFGDLFRFGTSAALLCALLFVVTRKSLDDDDHDAEPTPTASFFESSWFTDLLGAQTWKWETMSYSTRQNKIEEVLIMHDILALRHYNNWNESCKRHQIKQRRAQIFL